MSSDLDFMTARELAHRIARREISPVDVTRRALAKAEATQASLNSFFLIMGEQALAAAHAAEAAVMRGEPLGPLHGVPFSAKDLIAVGGVPFCFGSRTMADNVAAADAPPVERMKHAGAILIGKTTTSEFGCKAVGDNPLDGITRNPWNTAKTPGGSSAGAAACVAAGITPLALGTDGGGSVRIPCGFTGLAGIKGQFGRVPVWPVSATTNAIRSTSGPPNSTPASARGCAPSSRRNANCSIPRSPTSSMPRCARTCAIIMRRCSSVMRCATRCGCFSSATTSCCRQCCR
jgi:aspartyl-tRNA(Asn)/glutamyl-tRNA(Gln) amidotransferase subunit A